MRTSWTRDTSHGLLLVDIVRGLGLALVYAGDGSWSLMLGPLTVSYLNAVDADREGA